MPHTADLRTRRDFWRALAGGAGALAGTAVAAPPVPIRYLAAGPDDRFGLYVVSLLQAAGRELGYRFKPLIGLPMTQGRLEVELRSQAGGVDLMWGMSSRDRQQALRRVQVRLDQGLIGWRVLVVRASDLKQWPRDLDPDEVRRRRAGQGLHWPDVDILRDNGFKVQTSRDSATLYEMLRRGHIDYFPRSALEVLDELQALNQPEVAIAPELALRYDAGNYIFTSPRQASFAAGLEGFLLQLQETGALDKRFAAAFDPVLRPLDMAGRRSIDLRNTQDG